MNLLRLFGKISCCLLLCAGFASADSIQLRNGRHLQGKYIGGTTTAIGFMTGGTVEYFATSEVLVLMFENPTDSPLSELKPSPLRGRSQQRRIPQQRRVNAGASNRVQPAKEQHAVVSSPEDWGAKVVMTASK